jgi:hypothetical protein
MDIAAGYLALHRRNADADTTLKVVEYLVRGISFFTSCIISNILQDEVTFLRIGNDDNPVNIATFYIVSIYNRDI